MNKLTTLPNVFTFLAAGGTPYRMTKLSDGDYACTEHDEEFKDDGGRIARHDLRGTLQRINKGVWTFVKDITPLPRQFTVRASGAYDYDVDLDAQTMTHVGSGWAYKDSVYTDEFAKATIADGTWVIIKSKAERDAEAKALADAEAAEKEARKDAAIEAAKELSEALATYNNAEAKLAAAVAAL